MDTGTISTKSRHQPAGKQQLTARGLAALAAGEWANDAKPHGAGQLQARKLGSGDVAFYYRYTGPERKQVRLPLGTGITLAEAREKAAELSRRYQAGDRDLRAALEADQREAERQRQQQAAAEAEAAEHNAATLGALLSAYVAQLKRDGKASAGRVERALKLHVEDAWPSLWRRPANEVTPDDLLAVVARLVDADKLREAAKLRSYLSAAFAAGIRARQDARSLAALRELRITTNPARDLVTIDGASNARDRALSLAELRAYWLRITALPDPVGALLRFHLLTGGQRVEQLARLTLGDVDHDTATMHLQDSKGRRRRPRIHAVPLIPAAVDALKAMGGGQYGEHAFTVTGGLQGATYHILQHRLRAVVEAMATAGEAEPFTAGDLRRTIETRLAAEGVTQDVRAQLQSHGLGGLQARHYDRHGYEAEKRAALETLHRLCTSKPATVATLARKRKPTGTR